MQIARSIAKRPVVDHWSLREPLPGAGRSSVLEFAVISRRVEIFEVRPSPSIS